MLLSLEEMFNELFVEKNIAYIDSCLEELSLLIGRNLTEEEQSGVLDIVDEYTPKDNDGNYLYSLLPFDYAWQIYTEKLSKYKSYV